MVTKIVCDGRLKVSNQGHIWKIKDGVETPAKIFGTANRQGTQRYPAVSLQENGKQKHYFVHRLIAEAFVPNPENKPIVLHKNWDLQDNKAKNLEWVSHKERFRRSREAGYYDPEKRKKICLHCGELTAAKDRVCTKCKYDLKSESKKARRNTEITKELKDLDICTATDDRVTQIIDMRKTGATYQQIGERFGISRERVRQVLDKAKNPNKYVDMEKLAARLRRKKAQFKAIDLEVKMLEAKIEVLKDYMKQEVENDN